MLTKVNVSLSHSASLNISFISFLSHSKKKLRRGSPPSVLFDFFYSLCTLFQQLFKHFSCFTLFIHHYYSSIIIGGTPLGVYPPIWFGSSGLRSPFLFEKSYQIWWCVFMKCSPVPKLQFKKKFIEIGQVYRPLEHFEIFRPLQKSWCFFFLLLLVGSTFLQIR